MSEEPGRARLATVTIPAPDLRPDLFLRHASGGARGFWARGSRWVAHRGVAAEIRAGGDGKASDRFDAVARATRAIAAQPLLPEGSARAPRVRFYGGFSFRDDHEAAGVWSDFPSRLFHLPEFELEGDASGDAWLRARTFVDTGAAGDAFVALRHRAEALRAELATLADAPTVRRRSGGARLTVTDRASWEEAVEESLSAISEGRISKAVLARTFDVEVEPALDPADVVAGLWEVNQGSHVFLFEPTPGAALVGAAPETVATLKDGVFHATAVAGSIRRGDSPREQAELAARLLASDKDRVEQRIALDDMVARLGNGCPADPHGPAASRPSPWRVFSTLETEIRVLRSSRCGHHRSTPAPAPHAGGLWSSQGRRDVLPRGGGAVRAWLVRRARRVAGRGGERRLRARVAHGRLHGVGLAPVRRGRDRRRVGSGARVGGDRDQVRADARGAAIGWGDDRDRRSRGRGTEELGAAGRMSAVFTTLWARALTDELARAGVREVVVAPGSRSTPLVMAFARDDRFRVRVHLDERSAAFFALGVGKASRMPAVVVTTSGTAVGNLLPAVIEASQSATAPSRLDGGSPPTASGELTRTRRSTRSASSAAYARAFHELPLPRPGRGRPAARPTGRRPLGGLYARHRQWARPPQLPVRQAARAGRRGYRLLGPSIRSRPVGATRVFPSWRSIEPEPGWTGRLATDSDGCSIPPEA